MHVHMVLIRSTKVGQTDAGDPLDQMTGATRVTGEASSASPSAPIEDFLIELHKCVSGVNAGKVADYIPELGKVDPAIFGITLATVDGEIYATGDDEHRFTIQSVSKPFMYGYALQHYGRDYVLRHVGVEPTGEAFNSIVLDEVANRPFNPMVNTGAIAVAALMPGNTAEERIATMLDLFSNLAGRRLEIDQSVFQSEQATGHRNRAIAYMMLNTGMIERDPIELLAEVASQDAEPKFALSKLDVFNGLSSDECHLLETIVRPLMFNKGEVIIREGDQAKLFFVLARGTVSVQITVPTQTGEKRRRVASLGPGLTFGEMSLFGGGSRSADVVADEKVICYGLAVEELKELTAAHPNIMVTILSNLTRDFSERLRHANQAIRSLE